MARQPALRISGAVKTVVAFERAARTTIPTIETVIQECASLKYLLEDVSKRRKKKTKNQH
jgi:hypothetical protein